MTQTPAPTSDATQPEAADAAHGTPRTGRADPTDRSASAPGVRVRRYQPADLPDLYEICLRTGDGGADASGRYRDGHLLGHLYAAPYGVLEPERAFVLEDDAGVCGYVVGALDTRAFHRLARETWLPPLRRRYPRPGGDPASWTADERLIARFYDPESCFPLRLPEPLRSYPSHLHIDLLARAQGQGFGRRLLETFLTELRRHGSPGVHLGVGVRNERAIAFYRRIGFADAYRDHGGAALVMTLALA